MTAKQAAIRQGSIGGLLAVVVTSVLWMVWGQGALMPAAVFGTLALGIEVTSVQVMIRVLDQPFPVLMKRRLIGMGLRAAGIGVFVVAVVTQRSLFPPLPTAFGFLGVLIPLLLLEPRFLR